MKSWMAALRIARREAKRAKGRSALVLTMIALPVMLLSFAAVTYNTMELTKEEQLDRQMGRGDATISWISGGKIEQSPDANMISHHSEGSPAPKVDEAKLLSVLPPGSKVNRGAATFEREMFTPNGLGRVDARAIDLADPALAGLVKILEGKAPAKSDELALTKPAAEWLEVGVGDKVRTANPEAAFTVTAIIEFPSILGRIMVLPPGAPGDNLNRSDGWIVDSPSPISWDEVKRLNQLGIVVISREVVLHPPAIEQDPNYSPVQEIDQQELLVVLMIVMLGTLEIVLLAGPAFAVGARRRARDLALIAAAGGEPKHLRRIVLADGIVLGLAGSGAGIVGGILLAFAARTRLEELLWHHRGGSWRFFPLALLAIAVFAVITGLLAATVPAFTAAKQDVVTVLAGRRGITRSRKRWIVVGLIMAIVGIGLAVTGGVIVESPLIMAGIVIGELGLVVLTPAIIGLIARSGRFLPLSTRIAMRDTARNRSSAAPAISAVMGAVVASLVAGIFTVSQNQRQIDNYQPTLLEGTAAVQFFPEMRDGMADPSKVPQVDWNVATQIIKDVLPAATVRPLSIPECWSKDPTVVCHIQPKIPADRQCPYDWGVLKRDPTKEELLLRRADKRCDSGHHYSYGTVGSYFVIDDGDSLDVLMQATPDQIAEAKRVLAAGGMVVHDPRMLTGDKLTVMLITAEPNRSEDDFKTVEMTGYLIPSGAKDRYIVSHATAVKLGIKPRIDGLVASNGQMPTEAQQEQLTARLDAIRKGNHMNAYVERGAHVDEDPIAFLLALVGAVIALGAAGIATGLSAADGRADLTTLGAIGAAPGVRRRLSLSQAGVIAGLGAILGTAVGLGTAAIMLFTMNQAEAAKWPNDGPLPFIVDWTSVLVVLGMPVIAMLGAGLFTRSRIPIERPRLF